MSDSMSDCYADETAIMFCRIIIKAALSVKNLRLAADLCQLACSIKSGVGKHQPAFLRAQENLEKILKEQK
jgi:hypothetical protein